MHRTDALVRMKRRNYGMEKEERERSSQQQNEDQRRKGRQTAERGKKKHTEERFWETALIIGLLCPLCQIKEHQTGTDRNCQCTSALKQAEHRGTCEDVHLLCPL